MRVWVWVSLILCALWILSGVYLVSMDDCVLNTLYSGTLSMGPVTTSPGYSISYPNQLYAYTLVWLYKVFPGWSWYGIALITADTLSLLLLARWLEKYIYDFNITNSALLNTSLASCLLIIFVLEPLVLMAYTSSAILMSGVCCLYLYRHSNIRPYPWQIITLIFILLFIALCLRFQAAIFTVGVLSALFIFISPAFKINGRHLAMIATVALVIGTGYMVHCIGVTEDQKEIEEFDHYYFSLFEVNSIQDAYKTPHSTEDQMKVAMLKGWFFNDRKVFDTALLKKVGYESAFTYSNLSNWPNKLARAYDLAFDYQSRDYLYYTNWGFQALLCLGFNTVLFCIALILSVPASDKFKLLLFNASFWGIITAISIVVWMRHRVFVPIAALYSILHFVVVFEMLAKNGNSTLKANATKAILICLILSSIIKLYCIEKSTSQKNAELRSKHLFINNMNKKKGQTIVFSNYTLGILGNDPIRMQSISTSNQLVTTGDYYQRFFSSYKNYWQQRCGSSDFFEVMQYLTVHSDSILFIAEPKRIELTEAYLRLFYHYPVSFSKDTLPAPKVDYSVIATSVPIDYYRIHQN